MSEKLIVALDYPYETEAKKLVNELSDAVTYYKVGLELFLNTRGSIIDYLKQQNKKVFLDLKFHDIPNTVAQAAVWAASFGVDMFSIHASGGEEMMKMSMDALKEISSKSNVPIPHMIGVTILTSFDEQGIAKVGFKDPIQETTLNLAKLCQQSGLPGVVCSPHEVTEIKKQCGTNFMTICPGIRPTWAVKGDQKRITTPADAIRNGVDYMVVGRPITKAENPKEAALKIVFEIGGM